MVEKTMTNAYIIAILRTMNDDVGKEIYNKRLPVKLLYALRRSLPEVENAYQVYINSLTDICKRYGTSPDHPVCADEGDKKQMSAEIVDLMNTETTVRVHTVAPEILDGCGDGVYDALTYQEVDRLWWLIDEC